MQRVEIAVLEIDEFAAAQTERVPFVTYVRAPVVPHIDCSRCGSPTDEDCFCPMCGATTVRYERQAA